MSNRSRLLALAALVVVAAGAFLALRPSGDDATTAAPGASATTGTPPATTPAEPGEPLHIRIERGRPVGGLQKLTVKLGDQIHFVVASDAPQSVHLHGYDIEETVRPGEITSFSVPATISGVFEIELEDTGVQLAKLTVEP